MGSKRTNFNSKRFRVYPLIILIGTWSIVLINLANHDGWRGGFGQIIGSDFITLYSAGLLYRGDIQNLYDLDVQAAVQQSLIAPTRLGGVNPFISPPFVALAYSFFTVIPLLPAFLTWSLISIVIVGLSIPLLTRMFPESEELSRISKPRLLVIILAFFPFVLGWQVGQNHSLTLLFITAAVFFTLRGKPIQSGLVAGLLIYKPQFVLGFLILWLIWREWKALIAFGLVASIWVGISLIDHGTAPYQQYAQISSQLLSLPYVEGFPGYLLVTIYGFLATLLPNSAADTLSKLVYPLMIIYGMLLAWLALKMRKLPILERMPAIILAVLLPLVASPYVLFHDLLVLFPVFILWLYYGQPNRFFLFSILIFYIGGLILPIASFYIQIAIMVIIPLVILVGVVKPIQLKSLYPLNSK